VNVSVSVRNLRPLATAAYTALSCLAFPVLASHASAQTTPAKATPAPVTQEGDSFTLKAYSRLTVVDVTVVDGKENPVHGLPATAFTVLEDGKPQPLRSFSEVGKDTPMVTRQLPKLPPHIYTNLQPAPASSAVNLILIDSLNTTPQDQIFVKQETVNYLKSMQPGTRIAIMTLGSSLRLLQGFTSDPEVLIAAVKTRKNRALPSPFDDSATDDAMATQMDISDSDAAAAIQAFQNQQQSFQNDIKNRMTLEALDQIAAYLSGIKGRKNLIWFTGGISLQMFPSGGTNDLADMTDYTKDLRKTTDMLTAAQIAVYPVDARGIMTNPAASVVRPPTGFSNGRGDSMGKAINAFDMKTGQEHLGMDAVADATGGVAYYNTNGLKEAVGLAVKNGENYYALSYSPPDPKFDGIFHKITVKVNVPGVRLSYRKGYYSDDIARNEITPGISLATTAPEPYGNNMAASMGRGVPTSSQLLFTVRVEPHSAELNPPGSKVLGTLDPKLQGKPLRRYDFQYSLPGRQIVFNDGPDKTHKGSLEFDIAAYDVYGKLITSISQTIDLKLTDERYQLLQKTPFQLEQGLDLPPGEIFLRLGILDSVSDKTGTLEIPVIVTRKSAPSAASNKPATN
jgi:VWFA-related protein